MRVCVPVVLVLTILFTQYFVYMYHVVDIVLLQLFSFFFPFYFSFQFHVDKVILKREKTELLNSLVISSVVQISLIHLCLFNYFDGEVGGHRSFLMLIKGKF